MGAIKELLPENWFDVKEEEITSIKVTAAGFVETIRINDDRIITDRFGYEFQKSKTGSIKEIVERLVMSGFNVEVNTKQKKEELT